ncbi:hypothetical protein BOX15_Mlig013180g1 [Macrostomum lignano]|uniref:Thioredoxin domain-containing protein n=2 Tax=Macrostomum lignano TaxID=282301 RepID=A0A267G284_9PLAT|nr:hypothetical protein BOX15_Mlig013180g1 [Macrostomum lignano]
MEEKSATANNDSDTSTSTCSSQLETQSKKLQSSYLDSTCNDLEVSQNHFDSAKPSSFFIRFHGAISMFYSKNKELVVVLCLSALWFLSNITILRSKEVRYQQYRPLFPAGEHLVLADHPDGSLGFLHPLNRSRQDHLLMLYAPWDAESVQAKPTFSSLALLNPQLTFAAVACWNVSSECWQRFHTVRFPAFVLLLPGLSEVAYSGPLDLAHLQRFLTEAPLGYRTVRSDAELLKFTQLYDNVVIGCYNLSAGPAIPGLHQFYAASVHAFDMFAPVPFLLPEFDTSDKFQCGHNGQIILLRSEDVALTPDIARPLSCSELLGWLRQHRRPSRLSVLQSPGSKSRRLADQLLLPARPAAVPRPVLLLFEPGPRHWDSPGLSWLRFVDAVYARGCNASGGGSDAEADGAAEADDSAESADGFDTAIAAALARVAHDRRLAAEAASLRRVCSDLAVSKELAGGCYAPVATAWQRLFGQRPSASEAMMLSGRLHRLCLLASLSASSPHPPDRLSGFSAAAASPQLIAAARSLHRLACAAGGNRTLGLALASSRLHPQLLRGLLGPAASTAVRHAVIVDLADGGGSATRLPGPASLQAILELLTRHHAGELRPFHRPPMQPLMPPSRTALPATLTAATLPGFALNRSCDALVLFHSPACVYCAPLVAMTTRLSLLFGSRLPIGFVDVSANDLDATWQPSRLPALLLFPGDAGSDPVPYNGPATAAGLLDFLARHSAASIGPRAWAGLVPCRGSCPAWQAERLAGHAIRLQARLDGALELAQFAGDRLAEAHWQLGRLIVGNWRRLAGAGDLLEPASDADNAVSLRLRARAFGRVLARCARLVDACSRKRDRSLQLLARLRRLLADNAAADASGEVEVDWLQLAGGAADQWAD